MKTLNIDAMAEQMFEPIEVILGGKTYTITAVPAPLVKKFTELEGSTDPSEIAGPLAELLGADTEVLLKTDLRVLVLTGRKLMETLMQQTEELDEKNSPGGKPETKQ